MDRIDAMRLFIRVADYGSFSKAAADIGMGQPTVSRRIQDLENQLDTDLFLRTTKSLNLTEAGERFYMRAKSILSDYDEAEIEARGLQNEAIGLLRVVSVHSFARRVIAPELPKFLEQHPKLNIDLISEDGMTDLVGERVDLAIRMGEMSDSRLMTRKLGNAPRGVWASPSFLKRYGTPSSPDELQDFHAVMFRNYRGDPIRLINTATGDIAAVLTNGPVIASSGDILGQAAADGLGYIIAPLWLVSPYIDSGQLVRILPKWEANPLAASCVWSGTKLRGKAKLFVEHMVAAVNFEPLP